MPKLWLLLLVAGIALPSFAAGPVTVAQLRQFLESDKGYTDEQIAGQLSEMQLTERLDTLRLRRWQDSLPGPQSREALLVLADMSAFLEPPAAEILSMPAPPVATQQQIIASVASFAKKTIEKFPDFFAARETLRFIDTPADIRDSSQTPYQPLHLVNRSADTVLYRKGREVVNLTAAERKRYGLKDPGLSTSGIFGPVLGMVLMDSAHGTLMWSHWEQGPAGRLAVFRYVVPRDESHYEVGLSGFFQDHPAYHGTFAVDPATGTVFRLTLEADMRSSDPIEQSGIVVEYGAVRIGGKIYICPLRSVTAQVAAAQVATNQYGQRAAEYKEPDDKALRENMQTSLNDVFYSKYHVFRADMRILTGSEEAALPSTAPGVAVNDADSAGASTETAMQREMEAGHSQTPPQVAPTPASEASAPAMPAAPSALQVPQTTNPAPRVETSPPSAASHPLAQSELTLANATSAHRTHLQPSVASPPEPMFHSTTRIVYVDVVVRDRHGHIAHGLTQNDFRILEDGRPQKVDYFRAVTDHAALAGEETSDAVGETDSAVSSTSANSQNIRPPGTMNIILFDLLDTSPTNQAYARSQMLKFLAALPPGHEIALFILSGRELRMIQNVTGDSALLAAAARQITSKSAPFFQSPNAQRHSNDVTASMPGFATPGGSDNSVIADLGEELSTENFQHGQVRNGVVNAAFKKLAQMTARYSGRKNLYWLAESFPLGVISTLRISEGAIGGLSGSGTTSQMISASRIAVYPISVLGMRTDSINAEMNGNAPAAGAADIRSEINQQDNTHDLLRQQAENIAEQTGGEAFVDTNNIAGALQNSLEAGENYYSLVYTPSNENWNGKLRKIKVEMVHRGYTLSYRRTYLALPEPQGSSGGFQAQFQPAR